MDNNQKIPMKNYLTLLILVVSAAAFYQIPYLRWTFYDGMMELSGLNNTQFGLTMSVYGTVSMILYLPGGIIADKISSRILVPVSLIVTGAAGLILMTHYNQSYTDDFLREQERLAAGPGVCFAREYMEALV